MLGKRLLFIFLPLLLIGCVEQIDLEDLQDETLIEKGRDPSGGGETEVDKIPPIISHPLPSGTLPGTMSSALLQVSTNEKSTCRYSKMKIPYSQMKEDLLNNVEGTRHSLGINITPETTYRFFVRCIDSSENESMNDEIIQFTVGSKNKPDKDPPILSNLLPVGSLMPGTSSAQLEVSTNENASCRYSSKSTESFSKMIKMTSGNSLTHRASVSQLTGGQSYTYYIFCQDQAGNLSSKRSIQFSIANLLLDGRVLYKNNCTNCHGDLNNSAKKGSTSNQIQNAIDNNGVMKLKAYLRALAPIQVEKIAEVLTKAPIKDIIPPTITTETVMDLTTNSAVISWQLSEAGTAQVEYGESSVYGKMSNKKTSFLKKHLVTLSGLKANTIYHYRILSEDMAGNKLISKNKSFKTNSIVDKTAPILSNLLPRGNLAAGTKQAQLNFSTNEVALCHYSSSSTKSFSQMQKMEKTNQSNHSHNVTGIADGKSYQFYVLCKDKAGNISAKATIHFMIQAPPAPKQIIIKTTSKKSAWKAAKANNSGAPLIWMVEGSGIKKQIVKGNTASLDLSSNSATATITIKSDDDFLKLTELQLDTLEITSIDVSAAINMEKLDLRKNKGLTAIDISKLTKMYYFIAGDSNIIRLDISNNPLLNVLAVNGGNHDNDSADQILNDLDRFGVKNGAVYLHKGPTKLSARSYHAYHSLLKKGWKIYSTNKPPVPIVPILSNIKPRGDLGVGTTKTSISFKTDQMANCRYSKTSEASFKHMMPMQTTGSTNHSQSVSSLENGKSYIYYILCQNKEGLDSKKELVLFSVGDKTAPIISNLLPNGELRSGTKSVDITFDSNEPAVCRYKVGGNADYNQMVAIEKTGGAKHSQKILGLKDGQLYSYVVKCADGGGNISSVQSISFGVKLPNLDGVDLYKRNCMSCHMALNISPKKDKKAVEIQNAISNNNVMKTKPFLAILSSAQIAAISEALKSSNIKEDPILVSGLNKKYIIGNKDFMASKFKGIFVNSNPNGDDRQIEAIIDNYITKDKDGSFGGVCTVTPDPSCIGSVELMSSLSRLPASLAKRSSLIYKTCGEVLNINRSVLNVLSIAGLNSNSSGSSNNIHRVFDVFAPGLRASSVVVEDLKGIFNEAKAKGMSNSEAWSMIMGVLCTSPLFEVF